MTCNNGSLPNSSSYPYASCGVLPQSVSGISATDGSLVGNIQVTWPDAGGATGYDLQWRAQGSGSWTTVSNASSGYLLPRSDTATYEFQVLSKNATGTTAWMPSTPETGYAVKSCPAGSQSWGTSNFCTSSVAAGNPSAITTLSNVTVGAAGSATATCNPMTGAWVLSDISCTASLAAPASLSATDGTVAYGIDLSWGAIPGASSYKLEQRKQGGGAWTQLYSGAAMSYNWTGLSDESVYEFQVTAVNVVGSGATSAIETGFIRKLIEPVFVSQAGVPAKIGTGQSFTFSQVWQNNGAETWAGAGSYGTSSFAPADTSVWGKGFVAFPAGSTATTASVTASVTVTAPATAGKYNLQRVFQKGGVDYGAASTATEVLVLGNPTCTSVTPGVTTFYDPNQLVTVSIDGPQSVESALVRVWTEVNGQDDVRDYPATFENGQWTTTVDMKNHSGYGVVFLRGVVSNTVLATNENCATASATFVELPVPQLLLTPTQGGFGDASDQGFVTQRSSGLFAKATVTLPGYNQLKAKIEVRNESGALLGSALQNVATGIETNVETTQTTGNAWADFVGSVRVSYSDANAALQGKELIVPVRWKLSPVSMSVGLTFGDVLPLSALATVSAGGAFNESAHGQFVARLEYGNGGVFAENRATDSVGHAPFTALDYGAIYNRPLIGVMTAVPPSGVNLLQPIEFFSSATSVPVQAPTAVSATDGTREDDVEVTWVETVTGSPIRYRIYRDSEDITGGSTGLAVTTFLDTPPVRGQVYAYSVKSEIDGNVSAQKATDPGHVPACRAPRIVGATVNADMTAINGLVQQWDCLKTVEATGGVDTEAVSAVTLSGAPSYLSFNYPLAPSLADGAHVFKLTLKAPEITLNSEQTFEVPFTLDRASITVNEIVITYDGAPATAGVETNSIGRMGVTVTGGSGIGFAVPVTE